MDAIAARTISSRPRSRANDRHSEQASLRKNFRDRILSYVGNVTVRRERMDGAFARERVDRSAIEQAQGVFAQQVDREKRGRRIAEGMERRCAPCRNLSITKRHPRPRRRPRSFVELEAAGWDIRAKLRRRGGPCRRPASVRDPSETCPALATEWSGCAGHRRVRPARGLRSERRCPDHTAAWL